MFLIWLESNIPSVMGPILTQLATDMERHIFCPLTAELILKQAEYQLTESLNYKH